MTEFEEYQEHTQYTHNAFCRIVIRHASIDAARKLYSKWKREISLEYLSEEKFMPFAATDEYFAQPPSSEEYLFTVCGQTVMLSNTDLAAALSSLPETEQEIIFLYFSCKGKSFKNIRILIHRLMVYVNETIGRT